MATLSTTTSLSDIPGIMPSPVHTNGSAGARPVIEINGTGPTSTSKRSAPKYQHVAAVHSQTRTSCLSHDSKHAPSFLGFRNLMVIVLSMWILLFEYRLGDHSRIIRRAKWLD